MYDGIENLGTLERSQPLAGTLLRYNPFFERVNYSEHDLLPRRQCCKSGRCIWYYQVRKIPGCYIRSPFQSGKIIEMLKI